MGKFALYWSKSLKASAFVALTLWPTEADSRVVSMICENPLREYMVRFDESWRTLVLDDGVEYKVLGIEKSDERHVVFGLTVKDGPTFRAHFRPYKKMEFFNDEELMQTDGCR